MRRIEIALQGPTWAIKHNGGFLGYAATELEAARIADDLRKDFVTKPLWPARSLAAVAEGRACGHH